VGLGSPSPTVNLKGIHDEDLLKETDMFLAEARKDVVANVTRVKYLVTKNRLLTMRCKSGLEKAVDAFTAKQIQVVCAMCVCVCVRECECPMCVCVCVCGCFFSRGASIAVETKVVQAALMVVAAGCLGFSGAL
jgi:hypothetical protein